MGKWEKPGREKGIPEGENPEGEIPGIGNPRKGNWENEA